LDGGGGIVGVVGQLQLEVLISRLEVEYKVDAVLEPSPWDTARWITASAPALKTFAEGAHSAQLMFSGCQFTPWGINITAEFAPDYGT
jgi:peptide subunit release factor RF-3